MSIIATTNERLTGRQRYVNPFRPHFEKWPAIAWSATAAVLVLMMLPGDSPRILLFALALISAGVSVPWVLQWLRLSETAERMQKREVTKIPVSEALKLLDPEGKKTLIGWGFDWNVDEAQLAREVAIADPAKLAPLEDLEAPGQSWIHGIGAKESPIYLPVTDEHTLIVAMTRWGKSVLFRLMILQAIKRGETVICFDPKGDQGMRETVREACRAAGVEMLEFNTAFPNTSVRLDPLRNFDNPSELASRIAGLLGQSQKDQSFTAFNFMILTNVINGMLHAGERPTLVAIKRYLDGGLESLLVKAITAYCNRIYEPGWEKDLDAYKRIIIAGRRSKDKKEQENAGLVLNDKESAAAITEYYRAKIQGTTYSNPEIEGLISTVEHPADHRSKMTASLMPVLTKLTSGPMARLLSTDMKDPDDVREVTDLKRVIEERKVIYIGLNSLADADVANALGQILLADLAAVAGSSYNYSGAKKRKIVSIFCDEAAEIFNAALIKLLNKGGGAGYRLVMATQTISDIIAKLGDAASAGQVIGNIANFIFGRVADNESQEFFCNRLAKVPIKSMDYSRTVSSPTDDPMSFTVGQGENLTTKMEAPIEPPCLGALPRFNFFALIGSRLVKGRIPIVIPDEALAA